MSALRLSVAVLSLVAAGTAHASTVASCAATAQQQNSGAQVSVTVNQTAVVTNGTVAQALTALAATSPADAVAVSANLAGGQALLDVQTCALDGEALSWSLVRLFDVAPTCRVRDHLYRRVEPSGPVYVDKAWLTVDGAGIGWVNFSQVGGTTSSSFPVAFRATGAGDYELRLTGRSPPGHACLGRDCERSSWIANACACAEPSGPAPRADHQVTGAAPITVGAASSYLAQ